MENKIEKEYNNLCKKYKLPKFNEIDSEFEISTLENERFLIKGILKKILEKLEFYIDIIDRVIHPDAASLGNMYEIKYFSDDEKNDMYKLFKKLMKNNRNTIKLMLENNEKQQVYFLNKFFNEWLNIKRELAAYLSKMEESWEKESTIKEDVGYLG